MKVIDNGSFYTVRCSLGDVETFARSWPCFGTARAISFQFHKRTGDLVDIMPPDADRAMDGAGVAALAQDAARWGAVQLGGAI